MILNREQILERIEQGMITNYVDLDYQVQPNGFDLTWETINEIYGMGVIDFDNGSREIPKYDLVRFASSGTILQPGVYNIKFRERMNIPSDLIALGYTRSSLLRMGNFMPSAVWDAGFKGKGEGLLVVNKTLKLLPNARLMQLVFFDREDSEYVYDGMYNER